MVASSTLLTELPLIASDWAQMDVGDREEYYNRFIAKSRVKEELPWQVLDPMPTGFKFFDPNSRPTSAVIYETHRAQFPEYSKALDIYQQRVLAFYSDECFGFPHYERLSENKRNAKFRSLLEFDRSTLVTEDKAGDLMIGQTMHGLGLAWTYFKHAWDVQCNDMKSPMKVYRDRALFEKALIKRMTFGTYISHSGIRKALRSFSGTQAVSNFRPTAAAAIYDMFLPAEGGVTWDMSSGFGGRLLGAMACPLVRKYIGTDPSTPTMEGLIEMRDELVPLLGHMVPRPKPLKVEDIILHKLGSEVFVPEPESIDLCFTSPPYFDTEKYTLEDTQSYIKYGRDSKEESQKAWLNEFMKDTLKNCHIGLKPHGRLVVNIAEVKSYPKLNERFVEMAEQNGWKLEKTMWLLLSKMMGTRGDGAQLRETRRQKIEAATDEETLFALAKTIKVSKKELKGLTLDAIRVKLTAKLASTPVNRDQYKREPIFVFRKA